MITRKNIRLKEYDYTSKGYYFITICTKDMKHCFGKLEDNIMILNDWGIKVQNVIESFNNTSDDIKNDYYQIMPNHIHIIIEIKNNINKSLSNIVSGLKGKCTKELKTKGLWQKGFYERVIRDEKEYNNIVKYINENPYRDKYQW